jgi:hypothetical protein
MISNFKYFRASREAGPRPKTTPHADRARQPRQGSGSTRCASRRIRSARSTSPSLRAPRHAFSSARSLVTRVTNPPLSSPLQPTPAALFLSPFPGLVGWSGLEWAGDRIRLPPPPLQLPLNQLSDIQYRSPKAPGQTARCLFLAPDSDGREESIPRGAGACRTRARPLRVEMRDCRVFPRLRNGRRTERRWAIPGR